MSRITMTQLQRAVDVLNETCGMPQQVWQRKENGETVSIPGCYVLDAAYGGYRLCQIVNTAGGERDITPRYPAGTAYDLIHAYMRGVINGRERHAKAA